MIPLKIRLKATSVLGERATTANSPSSAVDTNAVTIDNRDPFVATAAWSAVSYCRTSNKLQGTLTFSGIDSDASVTGISASDFEVRSDPDGSTTGWTFDTPSATAANGTGITIRVTPPANTNASFKIRLKATSVLTPRTATPISPATNVDSTASAIDNRPPFVAIATWSNADFIRGKITANLTFSGIDSGANVTEIGATDFEVINDLTPATVQSGWVFDTPSSRIQEGARMSVSAAIPGNTTGSFKIRLKATSVRTPRATVNNSPANAVSTEAVYINHRYFARWSDVVYKAGARIITAKLVLLEDPGSAFVTGY